ncbi:hypothetical protein AGLY_001205 [Aphis glycines]|uniref:Uncharacterized protein n=1 Tax=Aphis glycines TaxID=307491 RepID=A0A6G0UBF5_APHGL|nr:hypothetical protein AGLY_001205 [Aphis glycines]
MYLTNVWPYKRGAIFYPKKIYLGEMLNSIYIISINLCKSPFISIRINFSIYININASRSSFVIEFLNLFFRYLREENTYKLHMRRSLFRGLANCFLLRPQKISSSLSRPKISPRIFTILWEPWTAGRCEKGFCTLTLMATFLERIVFTATPALHKSRYAELIVFITGVANIMNLFASHMDKYNYAESQNTRATSDYDKSHNLATPDI